MVGAARGPLAPLRHGEAPGQRGNGGGLQCLFVVHIGQQRSKALRQHRLACTGRPHQQQAVPARRCDFECALGAGLAFDVGHVQVRCAHARRRGMHPHPAVAGCAAIGTRWRATLCLQVPTLGVALWRKGPHHIEQVAGAVDPRMRHQSGLFGAARWQHQGRRGRAGAQCGQRHSQARRAQGATRPTKTARPQTRAPPAWRRPPGRWPPECPAQWASPAAPSLRAGRQVPG